MRARSFFVLAVIALVVLSLAAPANATVSSRLDDGKRRSAVNVRAAKRSTTVDMVYAGTRFKLVCQQEGAKVGRDRTWFKHKHGGMLPAAKLRTPKRVRQLPACPNWPKGDDYHIDHTGGSIDPWRFYKRYCTSFAAYRVNQIGVGFTNFWKGQQFSNAENWDDAARRAGIPVRKKPRRGDVAQWNGGKSGASYAGHVGYVAKVYGDGDVLIEEYNWERGLGYGKRRIPRREISNFIRFKH